MMIKKLIPISLFFLLTNFLSGQGIDFFHGSWQEILDKAKAEEKLIFVDAYTKWCGPCKRMAKNVFTQKAVGDFYNHNFINVKMDMEHEDNIEFIGKYPVKSYPTLLFIDSDGKISLKSIGGKRKAGLLELGKKAILSNNKSEEYELEYEKGERSYDFILKYIKELNAASKSSLRIANDYIKSKPTITTDQMTSLIFESMTEVDSKLYDMFLSNKSDVIKQYDKEAYDKKVLNACQKTLDKGITFESIELVEIAIKICKKEIKSYSETFKLVGYKKYYRELRDASMYTKYAKKYYKGIAKSNVDKIIPLVKEMNEIFPKEEKLKSLVPKYLDHLIKMDPTIENLLFVSQYYSKLKNNTLALKYAEMALEIAKSDKKSTKQIELLIESYKTT